VTPVIAGADSKDLASVMAALRDLVTRARANKLKASELSGGSITITNLGDQGVEAVFGVLNHPQVALVGFGAIHDEPVAVNGMLAVRPMVVVSLAADHRASDGVIGARLLHAIDHHLHHPEAL
jgi:pyruvate dehydrogenase E2 component (dihydrolipoamide acetyltransferase)